MEYPRVETRTLWEHLSAESVPKHMIAVLQELINRVSREQKPAVLSGDSVHRLAKILRKNPDLTAEELCLATVLLGLVLNVHDVRQLCVQQNIPNFLLEIVETRLDGECLTSLEVELLEKATALLLYFSKPDGPKVCPQNLLINNAVGVLCNLCTDTTHGMYHMSPESRGLLEKLTSRKNLIGETTPLSEEAIDEMYCLYVGEGHRQMCLKHCGYSVNLFDTTQPDQDVNINEEMLKSCTVSKLPGSSGKASENSDVESLPAGTFQDIQVTSVVNGAYFWGRVGIGEAITQTVDAVQQVLEDWPKSARQYAKHPPKTGQFVGGYRKDIGLFRAQVLFRESKETVTLLALDYGVFYKVSWQDLFFLTPEMNLKKYPPQVVLCRLKDIGPVARNSTVMHNSLDTLCNLAVELSEAGEVFKKSNALASLQQLTSSPDKQTQISFFRLLTNLVRRPLMRREVASTTTLVKRLIDVCCGLEPDRGEEDQKVATTALSALTNILFDSPSLKTSFVECEGLPMALKLFWCKAEAVQSAAFTLLRVLVGSANFVQLTSIKSTLDSFPKTRKSVEKMMQVAGALASRDFKTANAGHVSNALSAKSLGLRGRARSRSRSRTSQSRSRSRSRADSYANYESRDQGSSHRLSRRRLKELQGSSSDEEDDYDVDKEYTEERKVTEQEEEREEKLVRPKKLLLRSESISEGTSSTDSEAIHLASPPQNKKTKTPQLTDTAECYTDDDNKTTFIKGCIVQFRNDEQRELRKTKHIEKISKTTISKFVAGFLNARRGGSIFFGIDPHKGRVFGLSADRANKDEFRQGVGHVVADMRPPVIESLYSVIFHPVISQEELQKETKEPLEDVHVIEIQIKPTHGTTVYTVANQFYLREGDCTVSCDFQQIYQWAVETHERQYLKDVQDLQKAVESLRGCVGAITPPSTTKPAYKSFNRDMTAEEVPTLLGPLTSWTVSE